MANRKRRGSLLTVDDVYRQPVGPASEPKSLYALLLRFVVWRRERNWSETTLKVQTHHQYRFILWAAVRIPLYSITDWAKPRSEMHAKS